MNRPRITWISRDDPPDAFPPAGSALRSPNGLLAAGGDLSPDRLLCAYGRGIFPWFEAGQPILWWAPDPRCILRPARFHVARRFRRSLGKSSFRLSFNRAFGSVIGACGERRERDSGTWITTEMVEAYSLLHRMGWAHSVEVWLGQQLVGGMYGIAIGKAFFGESMFSHETDASKTALLALSRELDRRDYTVLDCQVPSPHLLTLGATLIPRTVFHSLLEEACRERSRLNDLPPDTIDAPLLDAR